MKKNLVRALLLLLLIADMIFIFSNSAQTASASSSTSHGVTEMVAPVIVPNYKDMDEQTQKATVSSLEVILREAAHLLQFTPLGFALYLLLTTFALPEKIRRLRIPLTLGFGLIYAISDEIHQLFVPGRSFQLFDIFMDMCGVAVGCAGGMILLMIIGAVQKKHVAHIRS